VKFIVEGEEEVGSTALSTFLPANRELLKADVVLVSDTAMLPGNVPAITVGLRGIVALEVEVEGPSRDLHSGIYGGAVANPATMLCRMLSSLHTNDGAIAVPGYYDEVVPLSQEERAMLAQAPFDAERFMREIGVAACIGESAFTPLERTTIRPSLDINGMISGYTGPGSKTVLPSKASAKLTARLVPNQDASVAAERIARFLREHVPSGGRATVSVGHGAEPVVVSMDHPGYRAASQAMAEVWGRSPVPIRGGGSIPVVALFHSVLRVPPLLMGFGQDADAIHSPNESFGVENYLKGIETVASFMRHYVQLISQG
jgi:acetylornithine deacetylase/succinyl-diaminopimelate desuccinylase-like protein